MIRLCADRFYSSPRFSEEFLKLSSVYSCCVTIFDFFPGVSGSWWVPVSENCFTTVEGELIEFFRMASCGVVIFLHDCNDIEIPRAANDLPTMSRSTLMFLLHFAFHILILCTWPHEQPPSPRHREYPPRVIGRPCNNRDTMNTT